MTMTDIQYASPQEWELCDTDTGNCTTVVGVLLGFASSQREQHVGHAKNERPTTPCHACRWFEVRIIRTRENGQSEYVTSFQGFSVVRGETHRHTVHRTRSPYTVVEVLTQTRDGNTFIPRTSRLALSEAAGRDKGIETAWIDRAVS